MKRKTYFLILSLVSIFFSVNVVKASDNGVFKVIDENSFDECLKNAGICQLENDLEIKSLKEFSHDITLDLNGYSIIADPSLQLKSGLLVVNRNAKLTIEDSKGNGKISTGSNGNVWAAIQMIYNSKGTELAELVVNGGTIEGYYYGIVGNGNVHNTKVTINGGTIKGLNKEDSVGIYQPQNGDLIINNGTISGGTGIEIRSGNLTVNNGNISGIASNFTKVANKNGTTTNGVGIAIAQHTTKNPISVNIYDGDIQGQYAFYEWNPHNNNQESLDKISMHIYGGDFIGLAEGVHAVYSQDFTDFISGGSFNTDVTEYLTDDAKVTIKYSDETSSVFKEQDFKQKNIIFPIILIASVVGIIFGIIYCKKNKLLFFK